MILSLETSMHICSVALHDTDSNLLTVIESHQERKHAENLTLLIKSCLEVSNTTFDELEAIAVGSGAGSYTGLRIGVSTAKGLCVGLGLPLIGVPTLKAWASSLVGFCREDEWLCPLMDARRMEVFTALFDKNLNLLEDDNAKVIDENSYQDKLEKNKIVFFGNGVEKCKPILEHPNARFVMDSLPSAKEVGLLAVKKFHQQQFEDLAYFEPNYGKAFYTTAKKVITA